MKMSRVRVERKKEMKERASQEIPTHYFFSSSFPPPSPPSSAALLPRGAACCRSIKSDLHAERHRCRLSKAKKKASRPLLHSLLCPSSRAIPSDCIQQCLFPPLRSTSPNFSVRSSGQIHLGSAEEPRDEGDTVPPPSSPIDGGESGVESS